MKMIFVVLLGLHVECPAEPVLGTGRIICTFCREVGAVGLIGSP